MIVSATAFIHKEKIMSKKETVVVAYKGFNPDLRCHDYQFEIGEMAQAAWELSVLNKAGIEKLINELDGNDDHI